MRMWLERCDGMQLRPATNSGTFILYFICYVNRSRTSWGLAVPSSAKFILGTY